MGIIEENKHLEESDKKYIWHPFTQMKDWLNEKPIIISGGRDCFVKDIYGNWYLDGVSSLWVNIHGHRKKEIDDAIREQLDKISHSTMLGLSNVPAIKLAERLVKIIQQSAVSSQQSETGRGSLLPALCPLPPNKVFYSDNGSTAVEVALKVAFQYWLHKGKKGKISFLSLKNGYHGDTIGAVSVGGIDIFHKVYDPLLFKTYKAPSPYCYRCEVKSGHGLPLAVMPDLIRHPEVSKSLDSGLKTAGMTDERTEFVHIPGLNTSYPDCRLACLAEMEEILKANSDEIASVIIEPIVQAAGGMIVSPCGYLKGVRELCTKYNVLMIADEVATGFGRTGKMFACEHEGVMPDIICLSKGITGGYLPLAATLATEEIYNAFLGEFKDLKTFFHGHSYTGNPLGCAAALACLDIFEIENTLEALKPKIEMFESFLRDISSLDHVGDVRNKGMMAGIELVKNKSTKEPYSYEEKMGWRVCYYAREHGVILRPLGNVIVIMPPLSISLENLEQLLKIVREGIMEVTK